jgi:predicted enzyme related to lactoylglutathione lyase
MTIRVSGVAQVVVFVDEPAAAARFWAELLEAPHRLADGGALVELESLELFFHPVDDERAVSGELKNPRGASTVVYFAVDDFEVARVRLLAAGCEPWRGPIAIEDGRRICQMRDPYGTVWGLDGPG